MIAYFEALLRAERSPPLRAALAADLHAFQTALTTGIARFLARRPESESPDPEAAASLITATFDGLIIQWLLDPQQIPGGQLIADTLHRTAILAASNPESIERA